MSRFLLALSLASLLLAETPDPSKWEYRRRLAVSSPGVLHLVRLGPEILAHARPDLADLRIVHQDTPLPYSIETLSGSIDEQSHAATITGRERTADGELQFVVRAPAATRHSRLRLLTSERGFQRAVHLESSIDGKSWDTLLDRAYIMVHEQDGATWKALDIAYPPSTQPYLRVRIGGWPDPRTLTGAVLLLRKETRPLMQTVRESKPEPETPPDPTVTLLRLDFGAKPAPWSRLRIDTGSQDFLRPARVTVSDDGKSWRTACSGVLVHSAAAQEFTLPCGDQQARYARLYIYNRDERPIRIDGITAEALVRMLRFVPREKGEHSLWYGNPGATPVAYGLAIIPGRDSPIERIVLVPGPERRYGDPLDAIREWTGQHPAILYGAVFAVAAIIAAYTLRLMKKMAARGGAGNAGS